MAYTCDALVIGAGYIGCSVAYHLASAGLNTALLEQGRVAAGASGANYGNIQLQDAELTHSLPMITAGWACFEHLEEELGCSVGYRPLGSLLLIETEAQWQTMAARLPALHTAGIRAEIVPARHLPELEPLLDPQPLLAACYHPNEGQLYPFALMWAYLHRALERGLSLHTHTGVVGFNVQGGRIRGVHTNRGYFSTGVVVLCTGAWTPQLGQTLGHKWHIRHVHGQALATEAVNLRLGNHIASAAFFEDIESGGSTDAVLAVSQSAYGNFLLGEAGVVTTGFGSKATPAGQTAVTGLVKKYFPRLQHLRILRGWAAAVAFTPDGLPYFGPVEGVPGLILATAFKSTVIVTPLVGKTVRELVVNGRTTLNLAPFSPGREINCARH